jgi:hypothetical protein
MMTDVVRTLVDRVSGYVWLHVVCQAHLCDCWLLLSLQAFSAVGAMQGAWHLATGQTLSLSEQQLVDCSWEYGNNGCQGGEMEPAIQYVADAGGAASEEDYQYRGQNMFCG